MGSGYREWLSGVVMGSGYREWLSALPKPTRDQAGLARTAQDPHIRERGPRASANHAASPRVFASATSRKLALAARQPQVPTAIPSLPPHHLLTP